MVIHRGTVLSYLGVPKKAESEKGLIDPTNRS